VILKNMFHPDELAENPVLKEELEGDIRDECAKLGKVDKVRRRPGRARGGGGGGEGRGAARR
jgi:hypothetical protein